MNSVLIIIAVIFCMHVIKTNTDDDINFVATTQVDGQKNLDAFGGSIKDADVTEGTTGSDDVKCTTIDDVSAVRRSLCPAQCECSPLEGQEVFTKLSVDCSGDQFNQSTSSRLIKLLSRCVSELVELTVTNTPITTVPEVVCQLSKIRSLSLDSNRLASLPSNCFTRMRNLTKFSAHNNLLTSLQVR